jgi:hypothetical protein
MPDMAIIAFPRLASLSYFQDLCTPHAAPILRPEPPTPRKMMPQLASSPASSPLLSKRRRYSGIPRPASGASRRATSQALSNEVSTFSISSRTYTINPRRPLRSDAHQSPGDCPQATDQDLSGLRQQLHVRNFSTHSVKGLEALSSPCHTAVRSLMRPLGPPMPRSHTVGNFTSTGKLSTPPNKHLSDASPEIDVVDALHESRMTQEEVDLLNRIEREKALNKMRVLSTARKPDLACFLANTTQVEHEFSLDSSSLLSARAAAARARIQQQMRRKTANSFGKSGLQIDPALANQSRTPRASLPAPKSAMSIVSSPGEDHEIDPRHVSKIAARSSVPSKY